MNIAAIEDFYEHQLEKQMTDKTRPGYDAGIETMQNTLSLAWQDKQGRYWMVTRHERECFAAGGKFYHMAGTTHSVEPACERSKKIFSHVTAMNEKYKEANVTAPSVQPKIEESEIHLHQGIFEEPEYDMSAIDGDISELLVNELKSEICDVVNDVVDISSFDWEELQSIALD